VVASVLMSMGMMMLPPVVASLPFKLISLFSSMAGLIKLWNIEPGTMQEIDGAASGQGGKLRFSRDFADRPRRS